MIVIASRVNDKASHEINSTEKELLIAERAKRTSNYRETINNKKKISSDLELQNKLPSSGIFIEECLKII